MKKSFIALFLLLTLAYQGTWCGAERSHMIDGAHPRPHLQVGELHVTEGKKVQEVQVSRKLDQEGDHNEVKVLMRMAIAHKGGGTGGVGGGVGGGPGGGSSGGRTNINGGATDTRPHTGRSNAAAMAAPATTSLLALAFITFHLKMMKSFLALILLLTLASQGTWCASADDHERSHRIYGAHRRPHLQVKDLHVTESKKLLKIQVPRKLGQADEHTHHDQVKVPMRMAIGAHKGGSTAAATGGGGVAETRPHNGKNGAAALPTPAKTFILALASSCAIFLSAFSF
uniref:Uncharacterized protein n=1 Tax=Leersia perrieri TaxID=77586 RepID=A0A0D9X638_9ORYZ